MGRILASTVSRDGWIDLNRDVLLEPAEWEYIIIFQQLHLIFGHFDAEKMPNHGYQLDRNRWELACNIYNQRFLSGFHYGKMPFPDIIVKGAADDEIALYDYLWQHPLKEDGQKPAEVVFRLIRMRGLEQPVRYGDKEYNLYAVRFADAIRETVETTLYDAGDAEESGKMRCSGLVRRQRDWFISHYPLLGALAAAFRIVEDSRECYAREIQVAAVDAERKTIYLNPSACLGEEEVRFVIAHEILHVGLLHHSRSVDKNAYLWNVACDYVINDWLREMEVGVMPADVLYDQKYHGMSADSIYDELLKNLKASMRLLTLRGNGKGDVMAGGMAKKSDAVGLDDFFREALSQGLEFHREQGRGYLPAGLVEEIRALQMPVIPWDVRLAEWFELFFPNREQRRSYGRPSRRQSSTPDIPRAGRIKHEDYENGRTFGVVVDTSGSMDVKLLGKALGSISSLAAAKEVSLARVVFCDADAYDAGYLAPDDIAGTIKIKGRGGTVLQPGIRLLERADDFPKKGPILIITDGWIEDHLTIHREHAFLIPAGNRLPFKAKGKVFYMK